MEQEHGQAEISEFDGNGINKQQQWADVQVTSLERQLLLNNNATVGRGLMSNWTKVFLCALSVIIPGIGQIIGIIAGLVMVSDDCDSDKRTYGAALLTVSIIVFIILLIFWFTDTIEFGFW
ncbi:MAG: hypothetical protein K0R50_3454 [Eubacterium sp.]|nr:hypothetical protein [Eubacterium sp.]